ncbi:unnamed protein product [Lactuca virosa]|uniref:Uncharacterized protein n=1 Tax=Lactuca virosa TaxID=75947 RepID=A0AAU9PJ38_9ASTR|nr:unnamed protein product [Lactuca virosa]
MVDEMLEPRLTIITPDHVKRWVSDITLCWNIYIKLHVTDPKNQSKLHLYGLHDNVTRIMHRKPAAIVTGRFKDMIILIPAKLKNKDVK